MTWLTQFYAVPTYHRTKDVFFTSSIVAASRVWLSPFFCPSSFLVRSVNPNLTCCVLPHFSVVSSNAIFLGSNDFPTNSLWFSDILLGISCTTRRTSSKRVISCFRFSRSLFLVETHVSSSDSFVSMPWIFAFRSFNTLFSFLCKFPLSALALLNLFFTSPVSRYKEAKDFQMYTVVRLLALQAVNIALAITKMLAYATALVN